MTWQLTLGLCLYVAWVGLHAWLGKMRHGAVLGVGVVIECLAFAGLCLWARSQNHGPSTGGAVALAILGCAALFLVPAAVGAITFLKHRKIRI